MSIRTKVNGEIFYNEYITTKNDSGINKKNKKPCKKNSKKGNFSFFNLLFFISISYIIIGAEINLKNNYGLPISAIGSTIFNYVILIRSYFLLG